MLNRQLQNKMIDDCLNRLADGETIEACLQRYAKHREELRPILQTATALCQPRVKPSASANERMKAAMLVAYNENKEIEKSPVSYLSSDRYTERQEQFNSNRRQNQMKNRSIFTQLAGAAIAFALVAAVGWFAYLNFGQNTQQPDTAVSPSTETAMPTIEALIAAPTFTPSAAVGGENSEAVGGENGEAVDGENGEAVNGENGEAVGGENGEAVGGENGETPSDEPPTPQIGVSYPSPNEEWTAITTEVESEGNRTITLTVQDQSGTVYTPISRIEKVGPSSTEAYVFGWSLNDQYLYYADTGFTDGCGALPTFYRNLSRLDVNTGETELLDSDYLADVLFSPDGTQFAVMNTYWNNDYSEFAADEEKDFANITIDIIDVMSAERTSQAKISNKSEEFLRGALNNRLHWSEDGSRLVAELYDNPCPLLASEQAYQLINPEGESPLLISSADLELDSVMFEKQELTAERLLLLDAANNCEYSIDLASKRITSEGCPETIPEGAMSDQGRSPYWETRRLESEYGLWSVGTQREEQGDVQELFSVKLNLSNQETGVSYVAHEVRDASPMGKFVDIAQIGWSNDSRYFYFANLLMSGGCEDLFYFEQLQRIDLTNGEVEMIVAEEMAEIKISPNLGRTITVLSRSAEAIATVFDSNTAEVLSTATFDAKYLEGGAVNTVHYSSNGVNVVAQLHTTWCPSLRGDIDFWSVNQSGETVEIFSSRMIPTDNPAGAKLTATGFEENVLKLTDTQDSCQFDIDINTQEVRYTSCPERLQ